MDNKEKKEIVIKEIEFLEGPRSRWQEFKFSLLVMSEFVKGFRALHFKGPCVTMFGSARFKEDHRYYKLARAMGAEVAKLGFTVMTGGGPGIMEASNRGAKDVNGRSIGCNIILPFEQAPNPYLDSWVDMEFFFVRKVLLAKYSYAFITFPGGFGTMDEMFEAMTLIQTGKMGNFPIIVMGTDFYQDTIRMIEKMLDEGTISPKDMDLLLFTDDIDEAVEHLKKHAIDKFGLRTKKPSWFLGEMKSL
ncbi:MAG: TIGR00730 family Rossman fold protein [Saprospiraceae bacterium]|jgi:uncharacterized protein (TIGR00730 family)|nr:TIGR00730 family Rossman fold protein [Saprospiraceae bacterium]